MPDRQVATVAALIKTGNPDLTQDLIGAMADVVADVVANGATGVAGPDHRGGPELAV